MCLCLIRMLSLWEEVVKVSIHCDIVALTVSFERVVSSLLCDFKSHGNTERSVDSPCA